MSAAGTTDTTSPIGGAGNLSPVASRTLDGWRRHNRRLLSSALLSIAASVALWFAAASPDGRDPFYLAVAIEFFVWGAIDGLFAIPGMRETSRLRRTEIAERERVLMEKNQTLRRLLHWSNAMNVGWLLLGVGLLTWGYLAWSPSLVGHGAGVFVQAMILTVLDLQFASRLASLSVIPTERSDRGIADQ